MLMLQVPPDVIEPLREGQTQAVSVAVQGGGTVSISVGMRLPLSGRSQAHGLIPSCPCVPCLYY